MKALDAAVGVREIKALAELKDDWDTYGSPPPSAAALQTAWREVLDLWMMCS
jgi:hypothetical protein